MFTSWVFIQVYAVERQKELIRWAEQERKALALRSAHRAEMQERRRRKSSPVLVKEGAAHTEPQAPRGWSA